MRYYFFLDRFFGGSVAVGSGIPSCWRSAQKIHALTRILASTAACLARRIISLPSSRGKYKLYRSLVSSYMRRSITVKVSIGNITPSCVDSSYSIQ